MGTGLKISISIITHVTKTIYKTGQQVLRKQLWGQAWLHMKQLVDKHNRWGDTSFLLGGWSGSCKDGNFSKWKPDLALVAATINFAVTVVGQESGICYGM